MSATNNKSLVWCIDLDGTLIRSDVGFENAILALKTDPLIIFLIPLWFLVGGRPRIKSELRLRGKVQTELLPYNQTVISFLEEKKVAGFKLALVTASNQEIANDVAAFIKLFSQSIGTENLNLSGSNKADRLDQLFGKGGWAYAGNSKVDFKVWDRAEEVLAVSPSESFLETVKARYPGRVSTIIDFEGQLSRRVFIRQIRLHQWTKNLLLFVPLFASHEAFTGKFLSVTVAFLIFGVAASSVYILNDLLDLESDRRHPNKKRRPIASGSFPISTASWVAILGFGISLLGSFLISLQFGLAVTTYIIASNLYSLFLKRIHTVDILTLAGLYTLRIVSGGLAAGLMIPASPWLLAFSMFFFLSLACVKRVTEIAVKGVTGASNEIISGRGYRVVDEELIKIFGISCAGLASLVLALYISSNEQQRLYSHPLALWASCPIVLYWLIRVWAITLRREMLDDPLVFAFKDRVSYGIGVLLLIVFALAL